MRIHLGCGEANSPSLPRIAPSQLRLVEYPTRPAGPGSRMPVEGGLSRVAVHTRKRDVVLPGFFRPTKEGDLIALHDKRLLAIVEFKSQVGSFGNNFNNRVEEALGNATDLHTAYREGAFKPSPAP